ncbi:MAG: radical SAM protein [Clostridia bacterium]|nr:radical SAM protein [Clostridia bacterium]
MSNHKKAYLEITNRCNLSCAFCPGTRRVSRSLSDEEFEQLALKLRDWAEYLYFHLMGEPLAHPLLPRFVVRARELGFKPVITTNGTLLGKRADELIAAQPYKISLSLHSFEANDNCIGMDEYIRSCLSFAHGASKAGIITVLRLWNLEGKTDGALNRQNAAIVELMHEAFPCDWQPTRTGFKLGERVFLEWGDKFDWPGLDMPVLSEDGFCYGLRDQVGVLCDGTVVPCCLDGEGVMALGNLFEQSLDEILGSPRAKAIYDGFTAHKCREDLCKRCMRAGYYRNDRE